MPNTLHFLRHGKTKVDANVPISQWRLAPQGAEQAQSLADSDVFKDITVIVTSTEQKAIDTAAPIATKLGLNIQSVPGLSELDRDQGEFLTPERYEELVKNAFAHPDQPTNNWETVTHALARFSTAVKYIDQQYDQQKILIVGHGYTINLYFAQVLGQLDNTYTRLNTNNFGDWGIIEAGQVLKDIAP